MAQYLDKIQNNLSEGFHKSIFLKERRPGLYQVFVPFFHPDGDMVDIFVRIKDNNTVVIEDLGMTTMRLSYIFSLESKNKRKVFNEILGNYQISEKEGNLYLQAPIIDIFSYLMQFLQVIVKISDMEFLKREVVKSLFYEYFEKFIIVDLEQFNPIKNFYPEFDKEKQYPTSFAIPRPNTTPLCVYPIATDDKCNEVTITVQHYELNNFRPETVAVFENQESIARKPLARLSNVIGKQFASLASNEERITEFVRKLCPVPAH